MPARGGVQRKRGRSWQQMLDTAGRVSFLLYLKIPRFFAFRFVCTASLKGRCKNKTKKAVFL